MVLFFEIMLAISILGITALLVLKRYELRTGRKVFRGLRPFLDRFFHRTLVWIEYIIPDFIEVGGRRVAYAFGRFVRRITIRTMRRAEHLLETLLSRVREQTQPPQSTKGASAFLQEVADHKRSVMNGKENPHRIVEE